jgi:hypothetical protein
VPGWELEDDDIATVPNISADAATSRATEKLTTMVESFTPADEKEEPIQACMKQIGKIVVLTKSEIVLFDMPLC